MNSSPPNHLHVHKFGGTSLAEAARIQEAARLVLAQGQPCAIVVSALAGVTNALHAWVDLARARDPAWEDAMHEVTQRHEQVVDGLLHASALLPTAAERFRRDLAADLRDLRHVLVATALLRGAAESTVEYVAGHGELWSARLLAGVLEAAGHRPRVVDAREVLVVFPGPGVPQVDWGESARRVAALRDEHAPGLWVVTGYVASLPDGTPTTLKRNGSDYSASIFAALLDASEVTIWTDVDGVLSADPRAVPEAVVTERLSVREAIELAYFGAKVLHPSTMVPLVGKGIPVRIRNALRPERPGTLIAAVPSERVAAAMDASGAGEARAASSEQIASAVRGFASIDRVALVNVEGAGMIGVPGIAQRVFGALFDQGVNVILISQASSEHSICFAVPESQGALARDTVARAFQVELADGRLQDIQLHPSASVLAAVGDGMARTPGVSGKLLGALGKAGINVRAIAQGSSERNISVVVDHEDATRALRTAHAAFYLSEQSLSLGLIGPGGVGATLLDQLAHQSASLRHRRIDVRVRGIANSTRMVLADGGIPLHEWRDWLARGEPIDLARFTAHVQAPYLPHAAIIDCSAHDLGAWYERWLGAGVHVLTPNKKAGAGPIDRYRRIQQHNRTSGRGRFFAEATVGAGLPVLTTLRDLLQTGDRVLAIEGVLSGTLSYLFHAFDGQRPFSEIVREARARGYTEPDPRDDLRGTDVARKVVILARELGQSLELADVTIESLVPRELDEISSVDDFLRALPSMDAVMGARVLQARQAGRVLRYVGRVDAAGRAAVRVAEFPSDHAFARIAGTDNIIAFQTERYREQPLIVQGPGAGREVTAGGVFADLLRLATHLGAPG